MTINIDAEIENADWLKHKASVKVFDGKVLVMPEDYAHVYKYNVGGKRVTYKSNDMATRRRAFTNIRDLVIVIGGEYVIGNGPFDVFKSGRAIECKTIVRGDCDVITMHPDSLARKVAFVKVNKLTAHTVVFDDRNGRIYYKEGIGSFKINDMEEVSFGEVRAKLL